MVSKFGSRGKTQDRCSQGLITARARVRRTVDDEIVSVTPRVTASAARSVLLQRENGIPVSAGRVQARAVIAATVSAVNRRGRPVQGRSAFGPLGDEPSSPPPCGVDTEPEFSGDRGVGGAACGGEHDLGTDPVAVLGAPATHPGQQLTLLRSGEHHNERAGDGHRGVVRPGPRRRRHDTP